MDDFKLLPCPFCGSASAPKIVGNGIGDYYVRCVQDEDTGDGCSARTSDCCAESEHVAAERWNRRTPKEPAIICYWDTDDTEVGEHSIQDVLDRHGHDTVVGVDHVAVVRTTFHATLPAADDANSDDWWTVEAASAEEAESAIEAERLRRKALADTAAESAKDQEKEFQS